MESTMSTSGWRLWTAVQYVFQVCFRQEIELLAGHVQPLGPQLDLPL